MNKKDRLFTFDKQIDIFFAIYGITHESSLDSNRLLTEAILSFRYWISLEGIMEIINLKLSVRE